MIRTILVIRKMMFIIWTSFPNIIFLPIFFFSTFRAGLCSSCSVGSCSAGTWQLIAGSWQLIHDDSEAENEDDDENDNGNDSNGHWPFGATADRDNDNDNEYDNEITIPQESSINTSDNNVFHKCFVNHLVCTTFWRHIDRNPYCCYISSPHSACHQDPHNNIHATWSTITRPVLTKRQQHLQRLAEARLR